MTSTQRKDPRPRLPAWSKALLRALVPRAEREELIDDLESEYAARWERDRSDARGWLLGQVAGSVPALAGRVGWRGWTGFESRANRMNPGGPMLESWIMDTRYAFRRLRTRPTYALLAVLTLALGVGGTAAIFSIVRTYLMQPLPYQAEEELASFWNDLDWSEAEFLYMQPHFSAFRGVAAYTIDDVTVRYGAGGPLRLAPGIIATAGLFEVLGAKPFMGPGFREGDDVMGAEPVAVISHDFWRELGARPSLVGERIELDGVARTVVGVMPEGFWFPDPAVRVWIPPQLNPEDNSGRYTLIGRMPPGTTVEGTREPVAAITRALGERFEYSEQWDKTKNAVLTPLRAFLVGPVRPSLIATLVSMGLILLIACANVAALMLGQVDGRATELAIRTAIGAGRSRLIQQFVIEALIVGLGAAIAGALLAVVGFRMLVGALPLGSLAEGVGISWEMLAAALVVALVMAVLIALVPALVISRRDSQAGLRQSRTGGVGGRGGRVEEYLVVLEVAVAVLMISGAGLLMRSVANLRALDPGIETENVAVLDVAMGSDMDVNERQQARRAILAEVSMLPGIRSAGAVQKLPLRGSGDNWGIALEGQEGGQATTAMRFVTEDYFESMGITLLRGRTFTPADHPESDFVVVINQSLANKYFPGEDPLGRNVGAGFGFATIIGVVEDVAEGALTDELEPARYVFLDQVPYAPESGTFVLRVEREGELAATVDAARRAIERVAPDVAVQRTTTMDAVLTEALGPAHQLMTLLTILSGLALTLGAVGVYGIVSHFVTRQRREWGIRMALGLRPLKVIRQIVTRGGALVLAGSVAGVIAFLFLARIFASFLYGVGAADPLAMGAAAGTLLTVGVIAALVPALRASRIDPANVLREQ